MSKRALGIGMVAVVTAQLVGCVVAGSVSEFRMNGLKKAAFDMQCPPEQIEVVEIQQGSIGVRGCGHQARYEHVMGAGWVLNGGDNK